MQTTLGTLLRASTYGRYRFLAADESKTVLRNKLRSLVIEFKMQLSAWVILDNHYHLLLKSHVGDELPKFIGRLHGSVSHELNRQAGIRRRMWDNYWDTCIRSDTDYWTHFNYIHHNPVKHGYAAKMGDWSFSSYRWYAKHKGEDWLADVLTKFPVKDFTDSRDSS
jgi:putative transposase